MLESLDMHVVLCDYHAAGSLTGNHDLFHDEGKSEIHAGSWNLVFLCMLVAPGVSSHYTSKNKKNNNLGSFVEGWIASRRPHECQRRTFCWRPRRLRS